jgi:hypothetical protein
MAHASQLRPDRHGQRDARLLCKPASLSGHKPVSRAAHQAPRPSKLDSRLGAKLLCSAVKSRALPIQQLARPPYRLARTRQPRIIRIGIESARIMTKRRVAKGLWRVAPSNHPHDIVHVEIQVEDWKSPQGSPAHIPSEGTPVPQSNKIRNVGITTAWMSWLKLSFSSQHNDRP